MEALSDAFYILRFMWLVVEMDFAAEENDVIPFRQRNFFEFSVKLSKNDWISLDF